MPIESYEVVALDKPVTVYNFHVEGFECYYVSGQRVLVHNNNPCGAQGTAKEVRQLKKVKSNKEANRIAKKQGYDNAEDFKEAFVGKKAIRNYNIKIDPKTKEIVLEPVKKGKGAQVSTNHFID